MTALSNLRTLVRRDLKDEDPANYRWTDDEIDRAIEKAVLDYSSYCPLEQKTDVATVNLSQDVALTTLTDRIDVVMVEHPLSQTPKQYRPFKAWGDTLTFQYSYVGDGQNCAVYWLKKHSISVSASTVPTAHEHIIAMGAAACAISSQSQYAADRANTGGPDVDKDYAAWARDKFKQFYSMLGRISTYSYKKIKISKLSVSEE